MDSMCLIDDIKLSIAALIRRCSSRFLHFACGQFFEISNAALQPLHTMFLDILIACWWLLVNIAVLWLLVALRTACLLHIALAFPAIVPFSHSICLILLKKFKYL
jgi:hypothetical protein